MTSALRGNSFLTRLGRWATELVFVFVGVYTAFWLNNYQRHQKEAKRRDQILASIKTFSFFYDPVTKTLRKRFERYPEALDIAVIFFHDLERAQSELLKQIQAERRRR